MIEKLQQKEEHANLRIVEHLDVQNLPEPIQQMLSLASTPEEQDILLMATLTAASACVPNVYFRYGPTGNKLLLHMAAAYRMIEGDKQELVPEIKPLDQRKVLFEQ